MKNRILFVDDEVNVLNAYRRWLRRYEDEWDAHYYSCPVEAWSALQREPFDAIVSDVCMPQMTGFDLLGRIKECDQTREVAVIFVTGSLENEFTQRALDQEAADLINKPIDFHHLRARIRNVLRQKRENLLSTRRIQKLEQMVLDQSAELAASRLDVIWRLGKAAEMRDEEMGRHVIRVGAYARTIAATMGLDQKFVDDLFLAAPLHDVGKIGVPDYILLKPGKLNKEEWEMMKRHCELGVAILNDASKFLTFARRFSYHPTSELIGFRDDPLLEMAADIAHYHHERWDGGGYPCGLAGAAIPLSARITAIADVFDALRNTRPYKPAYDIVQSLEILKQGAGTHFDPDVYEAFICSLDEILTLEAELADTPASRDAPPDIGFPSFPHLNSQSAQNVAAFSNAQGESHDEDLICG
ncbi:HD domain-containing phosphohydrolase [Blastopirellula retiformator]|uniref:Cyclic di-GMP phosphodiesterase response regulator RpfG n=1 Tax=Blastopirellula retiformator TaxID=2527970 RepID=A0A5C5V7S4_9BACT|nr:HD domain-containing phosphohydrolase [Blastopirellula retiformator]TWT34321.1 Cyclic di-GMP phosphodiesterase response regulator RpfG [Blastopirellula retiformator]